LQRQLLPEAQKRPMLLLVATHRQKGERQEEQRLFSITARVFDACGLFFNYLK
jgi:hypothetical protein